MRTLGDFWEGSALSQFPGFPVLAPMLDVQGSGMATALHPRHVHVEPVIGTVVSLDVRGTDAQVVEDAFRWLMTWLHVVDQRFSTYRDDSEISRIDRGELPVSAASGDVQWVLDRCVALREETGGAFDVRAGGRLDPSALVKGWAVQRGTDMLDAQGLTDFSLNAGGDVLVRGGALPERLWRVGIQHPRDREALAAAISVTDVAVATSGAYERGGHLLDPRTGATPSDVLSVTVIGPDLGTADAYSTAAFALGPDGPKWTLGLDGYEAMTILADAQVLCTPGFPLEEQAA
jgi:thiamine biosynthesis lipoprotein